LEKRVKKIFNNLQKHIDAIIIKNSSEPFVDTNFFYVTGLEQGLFEGSSAVLFPDGRIDLLVSELESESAKKANANVMVYKKSNDFYELLKQSLGSSKKIGLNFGSILFLDYLRLQKNLPNKDFSDASSGFVKTRVIKDEDELKKIREAAKIADIVMEKIPEIMRDGIHEYELAAEINYLLQKNGADKPAFDTISSFGKNSAEPHYSHGAARIAKGGFVLCDFGACFKRYNSDTTRTFVFGSANEKQKKMYKTVLDAQKVGFEKIKAGIEAHVVHDEVDAFIASSEFRGHFIHSTGHSLGLSVHDGGVGFNSDDKIILKENMVLTVEPGVYIPGFGGVRIEDDILVKNDGIDILTKSSRELIEI